MLRNELPEKLFEEMSKIEQYPDSVAPVTRMINDKITAFFPGGRGLWVEEKSDTFPMILVLGQDFGNEESHLEMLNENKMI